MPDKRFFCRYVMCPQVLRKDTLSGSSRVITNKIMLWPTYLWESSAELANMCCTQGSDFITCLYQMYLTWDLYIDRVIALRLM